MDSPETIVLVEQWGSRADHEAYMAWRTETGALAADRIVASPGTLTGSVGVGWGWVRSGSRGTPLTRGLLTGPR